MKTAILSVLMLTGLLVASSVLWHSCKSQSAANEQLMDTIEYKKRMPEWARSANIYEVNTRQYTPEGTFKAFQQHLSRLKKMGVDILWFMPIQPIGEKNRKGKLGSYYSIKDYTAVNPEFGTEADFKNLVDEAHKLGMYVIIDWVANHSSWDNVWVKSHPEWYAKDSLGNMTVPAGTDWEDTADLDFDKPALRRAMIDAMIYWVKNTNIDGFRCDVAGMVPLNFWVHARKAIDEAKPGCFFLAEDSEPEIHKAFDMSYNWPLKDLVNDMAKRKKGVADLVKHLQQEKERFAPVDVRMQFITNHDENSWSGSEYERLGDASVDAFTVLTYTIPGMPLTYTGQEEPLKKRLLFFDKDTVGFGQYKRAGFLTALNALKHENKALWNAEHGGDLLQLTNSKPGSVFTFIRQKDNNKVVCMINFSNREQSFRISDLTNAGYKHYIGEKNQISPNAVYRLKPWGYSVFVSNE